MRARDSGVLMMLWQRPREHFAVWQCSCGASGGPALTSMTSDDAASQGKESLEGHCDDAHP
jgi:hypothetical protein